MDPVAPKSVKVRSGDSSAAADDADVDADVDVGCVKRVVFIALI